MIARLHELERIACTQLTSKDPESFQDLASGKKSLASLGVKNGDMVRAGTLLCLRHRAVNRLLIMQVTAKTTWTDKC